VQHHHAHIASVIAEHRIKEKIIGVCFDGTGYGQDGRMWGGEFFTGDLKEFKRKAHLEYVPMPGGDKATQEPFRMAISHLYNTFGEGVAALPLDFVKRHRTDIPQIITSIKNTTPPLTSSIGRLFDSISSLLGVRDIITYEAQAAIELQMLAERSDTAEKYLFTLSQKTGLFTIHPESVFRGIIDDIKKKIPTEKIARKFHNGLVYITVRICRRLRQGSGINTVAFSGGVFQNKLLSETLTRALKKAGFQVYYNQLLPANDGSVSLGQLAIANETQ
jgi:hydrogenase maturation protein HypF